MNLRSALAVGAAVGILGALAVPASAVTLTFATFQQNVTGNPFSFNSAGASSTFDTSPVSIPVFFQYLVPNDYDGIGTSIAAHLTMTSAVSSTAVVAGAVVDQPMDKVVLTFTADTPKNGQNVLLKVSGNTPLGATGDLIGANHSQIPSLAGDTTIGNDIKYTSDFLVFPTLIAANYNLSFTSATPQFTAANGGYVQSFTAAGTGLFASEPLPTRSVPEPGALATLMGIGVSGSVFTFRLRRRGVRA